MLSFIAYLLVGARVDAELLVAANDALVHVVAAEGLELHLVVAQFLFELLELLDLHFLLLADLVVARVAEGGAALAWLDSTGAALVLRAQPLGVVEQGAHLHSALPCGLSLRLMVRHAAWASGPVLVRLLKRGALVRLLRAHRTRPGGGVLP